MTRFLKHAATACVAAAFAIALTAPGQAQQGYGAYDYVPGPVTWSNASDCTQSPASPNYVPCPSY
jgi:hypothetical protein